MSGHAYICFRFNHCLYSSDGVVFKSFYYIWCINCNFRLSMFSSKIILILLMTAMVLSVRSQLTRTMS